MFKLPKPFLDMPRSSEHEFQLRFALIQECIDGLKKQNSFDPALKKKKPMLALFLMLTPTLKFSFFTLI